MKEYTFKTMADNEDVYYYDNERGVYVEWRIKKLSQLMYPEINA
jgi:hypothetical protein